MANQQVPSPEAKAAAIAAARHRIDRVNDWLLLGGALPSHDYARLAGAGVTHVLDLRQDSELDADPERLAVLGIAWRRLPVTNYGVPDADQLQAIVQWLQAGKSRATAYVHCVGGIGRAATVAAALLVCRGATADGALAAVRGVRREIEISTAQAVWLQQLESAGGAVDP